MRPVSILATGMYLPERCISNDELASRLTDTSDEWIRSHTGIRSRYVAADREATSDLAIHAARCALDRARIQPEQLGAVLVATSTPDYSGFPSTACVVQGQLGATNAYAMDLAAACSGFVYGLEVARGLAQADDRPILLIGSETLSKILDWDDHKTCVLFGDGAGAAVIQATDAINAPVAMDSADDNQYARSARIADSFLGSDGTGYELLRREGGSKIPFRTDANPDLYKLQMDGHAVFNFAVRAMSQVITHFMKQHDLSPDDVAHVIPHQANKRIIDAAIRRNKIPGDKYYTNLDRVANTSSASIPLAMHEMDEKGMLRPGDPIITVAFGSGLTYGGNLIYW